MSSDLEALKAALTRQLDAIDEECARRGYERELYVDTTGAYIAAPVIVALANVEIALLAQPKPTVECGDTLPTDPAHPCVGPLGHPNAHADANGMRWENYRA